jgi:DNA-binding transcriptional LysR family regulator
LSDKQPTSPLDAVSIQKLRIFKAVAELNNFTRAATHLGISQPVVSGHISKLEEQIGAHLFRRAGRGVALTEAGERVLSWANDILAQTSTLEEDLQKISAGQMGTAVIASSPSVGSYPLAGMVTEFARQNVDARIQVDITDPIQAVRSGKCDFAVGLIDPMQPPDGLSVEVLWNERYLLVCSPESEWATKNLTLDDLPLLPTITASPSTIQRRFEDSELLALGIAKRNIVLEFGHPEAVKQAVIQGLGCAFAFETNVIDELRLGTLVEVNITKLSLGAPVVLAFRKRKYLSPLHVKLIEHLRTSAADGAKRPAARIAAPLKETSDEE